MRPKELAETAAWIGGALAVVGAAGFGLYRLARRVFRPRTKAGAR